MRDDKTLKQITAVQICRPGVYNAGRNHNFSIFMAFVFRKPSPETLGTGSSEKISNVPGILGRQRDVNVADVEFCLQPVRLNGESKYWYFVKCAYVMFFS